MQSTVSDVLTGSNDEQALATTRLQPETNGSHLSDFAPSRPPAVTPGSQSAATAPATFSRLLSVREVAGRLGVCTSTVYKLCNEGKLAHVRVSNAIRVEARVLGAMGQR